MKRTILISLTLILAAAVLVPAAPLSALESEITVAVQPRAEVTGERIRLGDIALISGPDCALKNDLAELFITNAPAPGHRTHVRDAYVEHRLRASGLPLDMIETRYQERTEVSRASQTVDELWIRDVVREYLDGEEPYRGRDWQLIKLDTGSVPELPMGEIDYRIEPFHSSNPTRVNLTIYLLVDGKHEGRIRVHGKADLSVKAVVADRRMERGEIVAAGDLAGEVVSKSDLVMPDVIDRGDMVTIVAQKGPILVTAPGEAKRSGAVGENIAVMNMKSKKIITAEVLDPNTVRVHF
jgi:flagella basal body P-ring formation protein FlgA